MVLKKLVFRLVVINFCSSCFINVDESVAVF